ncbi:twin-arginine translocation signal domain-containing protein [bacterium]|nr:twin-arginine translocation signal domain-containing protein [bacterium]
MNRRETSRRHFLQMIAAGAAATGGLPLIGRADEAPRRPRVAAIFTVLRFRSHPFNILENFLGPYYFNGELTDPGVDIVALYADQFPSDDMARAVSGKFKIPLFGSIGDALRVGGRDLAVDAVLSIGEHGDYPYNERGQHLYPRKRFFDEAFAVMRESGRFVPFFNDKHWSYRWDWAREMFDTAREHRMPLLAGSSVPLAQRRPPLELPADCEIEEVVSIHGGGLESYDFHGLEVLQSLVEQRRGGETGIAQIELLTGDAFEAAKRDGRWSRELVDAAMQAETAMAAKRQSRPTTGVFSAPPVTKHTLDKPQPPRPAGDYAISVTYCDGLKATVLKLGSSSDRWNFACRLKGETRPRATAFFNSPWGNRGLFKALSHAIQHLFVTGREPWPAERTLLTTGAVEAVMQSFEQNGKAIETPHLQIAYQPTDVRPFREFGKTWSILTESVPQTGYFEPRSWDEVQQ